MKREKGVCVCEREKAERQGGGEGERKREGAHRETGKDKKDEWVVGST